MNLNDYIAIAKNSKEYVAIPIEVCKDIKYQSDFNFGKLLVEVEHIGLNLFSILIL